MCLARTSRLTTLQLRQFRLSPQIVKHSLQWLANLFVAELILVLKGSSEGVACHSLAAELPDVLRGHCGDLWGLWGVRRLDGIRRWLLLGPTQDIMRVRLSRFQILNLLTKLIGQRSYDFCGSGASDWIFWAKMSRGKVSNLPKLPQCLSNVEDGLNSWLLMGCEMLATRLVYCRIQINLIRRSSNLTK